MGSVKDIDVLKQPTKIKKGIARFNFSDRYSVFDWGEMPDKIDNKGFALCITGAYFFERLRNLGINNHYRGILNNEGKVVWIDELKEPTRIMEIDFFNVYRPKSQTINKKLIYTYTNFASNTKNFLIPFEIIYRNALPLGSSFFKRIRNGQKPKNFGLNFYPKPGDKLKKPILELSTKLEESDRYITWSEAKNIACLSDEEVDEIKEVTLKINNIIAEVTSKIGLQNEDGKIEYAFDEKRSLIAVDVIGTLDECRFTYRGIPISKEIARQFYKKTEWYKDLEKAKVDAQMSGIRDWKNLCINKPSNLNFLLKKIISNIYMSVANDLTGLKFFDSPKLDDVIKSYHEYLENERLC